MLDRVTLDASVVISAFSPAEARAAESLRLLEKLRCYQTAIIVPTLIRPEVVAAVRLATGDPQKAAALGLSLANLPGVLFQTLDERMAEDAAAVAAATGLRGADAVYVATARRFDALLITLDEEQRSKCPGGVTALSPAEAAERL